MVYYLIENLLFSNGHKNVQVGSVSGAGRLCN